MIVTGWRILVLREFKVKAIECPICKTQESLTFSLLCKYYHFFFIPFLPDFRYVYARCHHCGESIEAIDLEKADRHIFSVKQYPERAPMYTRLGAILSAIIILYLLMK